MIVQFSEIIDEVLTQMGKDTDSAESSILASVKLRINQIQSQIWYRDGYEWRKKRFYFSSRTPYSTGTVAVTKGSKTVTGSGTSWTDIVKMGYVKIDSKIFKVDSHSDVSSTSLKLAAEYSEDTNTSTSYEIIYPDYILDQEISGIVDIFHEGKELDIKNSNRLLLSSASTGEPREAAIVGRLPFTFYSAGDVDVTNGSDTVVGNSTTFTSDMEGMPFKVDEFGEKYTILTVVSATEITLKSPYRGDTGNGKSYKIAPEGSLILQLRDTPDDVYFYEIEALTGVKKLVDSNDESAIPNHDALIKGAIWLAFKNLDKKPVSQTQDAKLDYELALRDLAKISKVVTNVKWQSVQEQLYRKTNNSNFNPLA